MGSALQFHSSLIIKSIKDYMLAPGNLPTSLISNYKPENSTNKKCEAVRKIAIKDNSNH